jgi:hypothetical protein
MTSVATAVLLLAISSSSRTAAEVTVTVLDDATTAVAVHPTVAEAQRHVRRLRAAGVAREIVLDLSAGVHPPFAVGAADSGLHPGARTVYRGSSSGARTRISGGVEIPPSLFKPLSPDNPALLTADITSLKLDPASFGEIIAAECIHTCATTRAMLSFGGEEMTLARWPDFDRAAGRNVYTHLASGGPGGRFVVAPPNATVKARMLKWAAEPDGWLHGYWQWDWADCYRKLGTVELSPATWQIYIKGQEFHPTIGLNGTSSDQFRVRTVAAGGPDDPRHGLCKQYKVNTQNVLEQTHDNKTWFVAAALACGNR